MDAQDFRSLQEAYMEVVMNEENTTSQNLADRAKKLSKQRKGQTTQSRSTYKNLSQQASQRANPNEEPRGHRFTPGRKESGLTQKDRDELRGDDTLYYGKGSLPKNPRKRQQKISSGKHIPEQVDIYDIILSHLLDEGYADTQQAAEAIMVSMSEGWRESICEELTGERKKRALEKGTPLANRVARAKEGQPRERTGPPYLGATKKAPIKRGGIGDRGRGKSEWTGYESDRGSGNKASRRAGKEVRDTSDEL